MRSHEKSFQARVTRELKCAYRERPAGRAAGTSPPPGRDPHPRQRRDIDRKRQLKVAAGNRIVWHEADNRKYELT